MKARKILASFVAVSLAGASTVPPSAAAAAAGTSIGVAGAVKGYVQVMPSRARRSAGRVISSGKPVYVNEHITTGPGSHLQIMLKDETVFTIGPNSDIVLDTFVYNPETEAGKVTASVTKGVFRFITGNIGKKDPSQMEVKLPAGTIGIRGTIVAGKVTAGGESLAVLLGPGPATVAGAKVGAFTLGNSAGSVLVDKPGFGSTLHGSAVPPTAPTQIPADQMRGILGALAPKTLAARAEEGKQMMAERLAQKMTAGTEGGEAGEEGGRLSKSEQRLAEKLMSGKPLNQKEQNQARAGMKQANMSEAEMMIAEKMMAGKALTPTEQHQVGMMMAGTQMMEQMGTAMTPEQMQLAQNMMAGTMSSKQQQAMMSNMTAEQQAMMGGMLPPPGMGGAYHLEGGDPNAMMGSLPTSNPYGGIDSYLGTPEFFNAFYDPNLQPIGFILPPGTVSIPNGPTTWEEIKANIVTGTGYYPAQSGAFTLNTCNGGGCAGAVGTWGFSNINVDFTNKTIGGTANLTGVAADGVAPINDTKPFSVNFTALTGGAMINVGGPVTSGAGSANYKFGIGNGGGIPASVLVGNAGYNNPGPGTSGSGTQLTAILVGP